MKLFFFTNSYPYGFPDNWKTIELNEFTRNYDEISIFPFSHGGSPGIKVDLPKNIQVLAPMLRSRSVFQAIQTFIQTIFSRLPAYFLQEFFSAKVYTSLLRFKRWFRSSYYTSAIYFHPELRKLLAQTDQGTTWYFYWGNHMALVIPLIRKKVSNIFCRVHNSDLYKEASTGYLPYQGEILRNADMVLPCSEDGKHYLQENFNSVISNIQVARLGVLIQENRININNEVPFKIVSCAFLFPTKRIRLIAEALQYIDFPIHWTHVGAGDELVELVQYCERYNNSNVQVQFTDYMKHDDIIPFYLAKNFQLFLNVSTSEGIPVSIMEAMSVGIPTMATAVGGTNELVDESVGVLISPALTASEIANKISAFHDLPMETRKSLSSNAIQKIANSYNGKANASRLAELFKGSMERS
jgi:colanic acid/amylovoran biosynthesis glycosyltransferase